MQGNQRKIGVILSYATILVYTIVGLLYVPLLLHYMGLKEYGLYQLMGSFVAYFGIMDFGLSATVTVFYSRDESLSDRRARENILGIANRLYFLFTLIGILIAVLVYMNIGLFFGKTLSSYELAESKKIFILLMCNLVITLLTNIYSSIITANERFIFFKSLIILQTLLQPFVVVAVISVSPKALTMVVVQTIFNLAAGLIKVWYCKYRLKVVIKYHYYDKAIISQMLKLSSSVFVFSIAEQIFWKSNQVILGIIMGTSVVAVYSIAAQLYMAYMPISTVIQGVFLPKISRIVSIGTNQEDLSNLFIRIGRVQFIILSCVLVGFILFGQEFITLWVGEDYMVAFWITIIILIPFTIELIQNIGLTIMQAKNQYAFKSKLYLLIAILNIILSVFLARPYGGIGCAIATAFSMFLGNGIVMNLYYYKSLGIDIPQFWRQIFRMSLALLPPIGSILILKQVFIDLTPLEIIALGVVYLCLFLASMAKWGMNEYERHLLKEVYIKAVGVIPNRFRKGDRA